MLAETYFDRLLMHATSADFALMEASYAIIRILQTFPRIRLPPGAVVEDVGEEKQRLTLILASADGCNVNLSG